jgi:hypothetical protein
VALPDKMLAFFQTLAKQAVPYKVARHLAGTQRLREVISFLSFLTMRHFIWQK